jgi:hypothetical protein
LKFVYLENDDIDEYSIKATRTLYIGNLQSDISYHDLREIYSVYGDIIVRKFQRLLYKRKKNFFFSRKLKSNDNNLNIHLLLFNMQI